MLVAGPGYTERGEGAIKSREELPPNTEAKSQTPGRGEMSGNSERLPVLFLLYLFTHHHSPPYPRATDELLAKRGHKNPKDT